MTKPATRISFDVTVYPGWAFCRTCSGLGGLNIRGLQRAVEKAALRHGQAHIVAGHSGGVFRADSGTPLLHSTSRGATQ